MLRFSLPLLLAFTTAGHAQSTGQSVLEQALLLGPASLTLQGEMPRIYGEAGRTSYIAELSGPDCGATATSCTQITFQAVAPPAEASALANWQAEGQLQTGDDGWLVLSRSIPLGTDPAPALQAWQAILSEFTARFNP